MIKKSKKIIATGLLSTLTAAYLFGGFAEAKSTTTQSTAKEKLEAYIKFTQILNVIEKEYVDETNTTELINKALKGLMTNLDSHSNFMDTKEYKDLTVQTKGEFGGLGISVGMKDGALTVIAPLEGTPAKKAGIKAGDIILKINNKATIGMSIDESVKLMRGKPGTDIVLTVVRKKAPKPLTIKITRAIIKIQSVYAKNLATDKNLLYLHVTSFDQKVVESMKKAIADHNDTKGIILDLRNNPGGLLDQAVGLVNMFVKKGVIVSQKGRSKLENVEYKATPENTDTKTPMVVLVNGGSASASEIVSGALQDFNRSVIVGEKTFGKGSVQVVLPIGDKEALKLTVARYYLPSGRTIQAKGVTPDILVHYGEIPKKQDPLFLKEADLKQHLEEELQKIDSNATTKSIRVDTNATDSNLTLSADQNKSSIITEDQLYKDAQLKIGVDILKALIITHKGKQ
ncbi:S41 family peptidase [Sulfurovum sp.]|uniref:S41 family peptidase n=1 Tax=Sulfurovum sp. TaxID=1969726 RepID=UPI0025E8158F|nr:S41 family peptidase [Sulfurovum sp.]